MSDGRATLVSQNDDENIYNLKTELGNCKITSDKEGRIVSAEIKDSQFYINFSEMKPSVY